MEQPKLSLRPLMFETFACSMAMMSFVALAGPIARTIGLEPWHVGVAVTAAGIAWMLMSRVWGVRSDRVGRRPVLLTGLAGFAVTYALLVLVVDAALHGLIPPVAAFAGLVIARGGAGVFYAAVPTTSAALVADHVPPERRGASMAAIGASSAAGMVIGPGLAGLVAPISLSLPLYLIGVLPVLAFIVIWAVLPRTKQRVRPTMAPPRLSDPRLRRPLAVALIAAFSVSVAQITVGFVALDRLHLEPGAAARAAGVALAIVGVALVIAQTSLAKLRWPPGRTIRIGAAIAAIGFGSVILAASPAMLWAGYAVAAFGMGWVYPSVSALAANSVEAHEQGAAAGSVGAAQGLGITLGPLVGTAVYQIDSGVPYGLIAVLLLAAALWPAARPTVTAAA